MKVSTQMKKQVEVGDKSNKLRQQRQNTNDEKKPPAIITITVKNVKYEYCLLKTVHSMEELDDFRFQHSCNFGHAKRNINFTKVTLNCTNGNKAGGMCPFKLMVRRPHLESGEMHVYAYSEHNHPMKPEAERATYRVPNRELVPDANPPVSFTTPNGRQWTFLGTARNLKKMEKFRLKYHGRREDYRSNERSRISMRCNSSNKCKFHLLARKTDRHRFHMYTSGRHTCRHADDNYYKADDKKVVKERNDEDKSGEIQAEEEEQMDAEKSGETEEESREEIMEIASPAASNSGDIDEEQKQWPIGRVQRRLARALREESADKVIKWMARTGPDTIDAVMAGLDIEQVVKLLEMARKGIRGKDGENVPIWLCWIKTALASRGLELAKVPGLVDGLLSRILRRIERRELLPRRKLKTFRKRLATMREHMQQKFTDAGYDSN